MVDMFASLQRNLSAVTFDVAALAQPKSVT